MNKSILLDFKQDFCLKYNILSETGADLGNVKLINSAKIVGMTNQTIIFIVDDEPLLSEMLKDYLMEHFINIQVKTFLTGEKCLEKLNLAPSAIILDFHLNSIEKKAANGLDILKKIKKIKKYLPIIMLSSQKNKHVINQILANGATHYVAKGQHAFEEIRQLVRKSI